MENLPKKAFAYAFDNLYFYTAVAYLKLKQIENADNMFNKIKTEYPKSSFIKKYENLKKLKKIS